MMFLVIFCTASFAGLSLFLLSQSFQEELRSAWEASKVQKLWIVLSGALIALAQASACLSFSLDEMDSGPLQSVVIANVPIVGLFFYFWSHETLSKLQILGCLLIMAGISCMFLCFDGEDFDARPRTELETRLVGLRSLRTCGAFSVALALETS